MISITNNDNQIQIKQFICFTNHNKFFLLLCETAPNVLFNLIIINIKMFHQVLTDSSIHFISITA